MGWNHLNYILVIHIFDLFCRYFKKLFSRIFTKNAQINLWWIILSPYQEIIGLVAFFKLFHACFFTVIWIIVLFDYFLFASNTRIKINRSLPDKLCHNYNCFEVVIVIALSTHKIFIMQQLLLDGIQIFEFKISDINLHLSTSCEIFNILIIICFVPFFQLLVPFQAPWLNFIICIISNANRLTTLIITNSCSFYCNYVSFFQINYSCLITPNCYLYWNFTVINNVEIFSKSFLAIIFWNESWGRLNLCGYSHNVEDSKACFFYLFQCFKIVNFSYLLIILIFCLFNLRKSI